jgi:branched-chain amino acid transport system substrate-binding protein
MRNDYARALTRRTALVGLGSAAIAGAVRPRYARAAGQFKIGAIASFTGPAAAFSKDWAEGFAVYAKDWTARGGYKGAAISLETLDDETGQANAVNAFRRLAGDPEVRVIWIALASQTALAIKAISDEFKVPVISGGGVDSLGKPASPWFFKVAPGGSDYVKAVAQFAKRKGFKTVAGLHGTDAIGQSDKKWLVEFCAAEGLKVVAQESFATTDTNFSAQLINVRNAKPDVIYNGATGNPAILMYKQVKQLGIRTPMFLSQAAISRAFFEGIGGASEADGSYSVISVGALADSVGGDTTRVYGELTKALGRQPVLFHTFGWDTGIITEWAANHSDGTRKGLRDALDSAKEVPAINGAFTFTPDNHIGQDTRGVVVARLEKGKFVKAD